MPMIGPFSGWVTDHDIGTSGAGRVELDVPRSGDRLFATSDRVRLYVPEEGSWHRLGNGFLTGHGMGPGGAGRLRTQRNIRYRTYEGFGRCGRGWTLEGAQVASGPSSLVKEVKKEIRCVVVFSSGW